MRSLFLLFAAPVLFAQPDQRFAELKDLKLEGGQTLASCKVGYRTYGKLNAAGTNAILWPTWFSGKSSDLAGFIGAGRMVDPGRFYVITVDALGNGVSCSPSNAGGAFPAITIGDMVNAEYRLLTEHLGVKSLHAVMGISMGGMQTFEWMVAYPSFLRRAVPIVGSAKLTSADLLLWQAELSAIEAVQKAGGDPRTAMPAVLAMHEFALSTPEHVVAKTSAAEFPALKSRLDENARTGMDPRDWAAQLRAMMAHDVSRKFGGSMEKAGAAVQAKVLEVVALQDHMVNPASALRMAETAGFEVLRLAGDCGHGAPGCEEAKVNAAVAEFLGRP
ncbi:alpha/beta fold hydrolase [Paludibaculum fermentans]|uniref:Alpha/beta fold hydrolase n=1 Tax=Paludibaculum fermentans TaxID=1473598 RepID=A0A7S7NM67_PALFE|nr:alpha/beta fold hydrolase [Paludibaculum fermentans]QOY86165.1 alpha/beta fold hydrolase [Paludibaculum fermentans]